MEKTKLKLLPSSQLKRLRISSGNTQDSAAKKLKCNAQFISNWERGLSLPPPDMLAKLVKIYKMSIGDRVDLAEAMKKELQKMHYESIKKRVKPLVDLDDTTAW
jgi:transcriptional regulator with XRE-family HTH domain